MGRLLTLTTARTSSGTRLTCPLIASDHELDLADHNQIDIYNGRGAFIESQAPVWMYGTAFERSMLYNYQIANAKEIYMGVIQSETA